MKFVLLAALAAFSFGQDPKAEDKHDRPLTKDELLTFRATMAEVRDLRATYKIAEFNEKIQPKVAEQQKTFFEACKSVGVPEDKINPTSGPSECGLATGLDDNGNPVKDANGKPIAARVWWNKPAAVAPNK